MIIRQRDLFLSCRQTHYDIPDGKIETSKLELDTVSKIKKSTSSASCNLTNEDILTFVGSIILRHITQLICNASAIYEGIDNISLIRYQVTRYFYVAPICTIN